MRVDAHQHFWHYTPEEYGWIGEEMAAIRRDFLPEDLLPHLQGAGIEATVAVQARETLEETRWLLGLADRHPFIRGVVGWVDLTDPALPVALADLSRHPRLRGVRHVVQDEPDDRYLLRPEVLRGLGALGEFGLTYDLLLRPRHLGVAHEVVAALPDQPFVLDHLAKPPIARGELHPWAEDLRRLAALPTVYCKLSGMVTEADWRSWRPEDLRPYLDVALEAFGPRRLMIGSDWPVCTVAGSYERVMGVVIDYVAALSPTEREGILGGNAARFYGLEG